MSDVRPSHFHAPRRRARRRIAVMGMVAVIGTLVACEMAGWPFLAGPAERALSNALRREVRLQERHGDERATVRVFGHLRVHAPKIHIAAPPWSQQPFFLEADQARLTLTYAALWRASRGGALDIHRLVADRVEVHAERLADGRASWQFGDVDKPRPAAADEPHGMPTFRELVLRDGTITYVDVPLKANVVAKVQTTEGTGMAAASAPALPASAGLRAQASGTYGGARLTASLHAPGALALLKSGDDATPLPIVFHIEAGKSALSFQGTVTDVMHFEDLAGAYRIQGPSLAAAGEPFGVTLPTTGPFRMRGRIAKTGNVWNFLADDAVVGSSKLNAALTFDRRQAVPMLSGRVGGSTFYLVDLAPSVGAAEVQAPTRSVPARSATGRQQSARVQRVRAADNQREPDKEPLDRAASRRVLPEREFDLPSLRVMNANVLLNFERAELGRVFAMPLQPLKAHLTLRDAKLLIADIDARTADGNLGGSVGLDGSQPTALWRTSLNWSQVRMERWVNVARGGNAPPYVTGRLAGRAELTGRGRSTSQMLSTLDGSLSAWLQNGSLSHLVTEAAGIDVAQALGVLVKGDDALPLNCAIVDLEAKQGVLRPRAFLIDTSDSTIVLDGQLSLASESMDLRAVVSPKDFSPLTLRTPVRITGTFGAPSVALEKAPLARKLGSSLLLGLINPVAALIPLIDPGEGAGQQPIGCGALLQRAKRGAAAAAAG